MNNKFDKLKTNYGDTSHEQKHSEAKFSVYIQIRSILSGWRRSVEARYSEMRG